jgi:predicted SAM-dependent methyltransferase
MKYHLGCGSSYLEGYCNVDFPPSNHNVNFDIKVDVYADVLTMKYVECEEIRSHHFFEHFNYFDTFVLLYKWTNCLMVKGKLVIDLPDLEELCKAYLFNDTQTKFIVTRYMFGSHEADWAYHINGWSKDTLSYILTDIGYSIQNINKYGDFKNVKPNCGITITSILDYKIDMKEIENKLIKILGLYKNGDTDFENRLCEYYINEFKSKISGYGL